MTVETCRAKETVPEKERRNWPCGCRVSSHRFSDKAEKPGCHRPYYNNEELFAIYKAYRENFVAEGDDKETAERKAKLQILDELFPEVTWKTFAETNQHLPDKCCRLAFHQDPEKIANWFLVHGEAIEFVNTTQSEDPDLGIPDDPDWGWDMTKPKEGFPCVNLTPDGCPHHAATGKPHTCNIFPLFPRDARLAVGCSYRFEKVSPGRFKREGTCDRCGVLVQSE